MACVAGLLPLYGTCRTCRCSALLNSSLARCTMVPAPEEPYEYLPGPDLSSASSSFTFLAGVLGCTTSMSGVDATSPTGVKSLTESYGSLVYRVALIACVVMSCSQIV